MTKVRVALPESKKSEILKAPPQALNARDLQKRCLDNIERSYITLGESCLETKEKRWYRNFECETMEEYIEKELGQGTSTIRYYMQVCNWIRSLGDGVDKEALIALGATKCRILSQFKPAAEDVPKLVDKYKDAEIPTRQMSQELLGDGKRGPLPAPRPDDRIKIPMFFEREQWATVHRAFEQVREDCENRAMADSTCIEYLAAEYMSGKSDEKPLDTIKGGLIKLGLSKDSIEAVVDTISSMVATK